MMLRHSSFRNNTNNGFIRLKWKCVGEPERKIHNYYRLLGKIEGIVTMRTSSTVDSVPIGHLRKVGTVFFHVIAQTIEREF